MDLLLKGKKFRECDACRYRDHPVVIVGSNRFENDLLAHYIENQTPARLAVFENLSDVPPPTGTPAHQWRLVLLDCLGLKGSEILPLLKKEAAPFLQQDRVALINLKQEIEDTQEFISCGVRGFFFENLPSRYAHQRNLCSEKWRDVDIQSNSGEICLTGVN